MLEPYRSRYLRAMGIDIYVPRQPLPAAAEAQPIGWAVESDLAESDQAVMSALRDSVGAERVAIQADAPIAVRQVLPELDVAMRSAVRGAEKSTQTITQVDVSKSEIPRFSLLISRCETGLVVVDEGPRADQRREDYLRLLNNLLFALYRRPVLIESDLFVWPMVKNPLVDQSEQAARESLGAYLQRQCTLAQTKTLVALGSGVSQWMSDDPNFHVVSGISLWRCLGDGGVKQTLWQQLQILRAKSH